MKSIFLKTKRLPTVIYNSSYSVANLIWTIIISYLVIKWSSINVWGEFMTIAAIITLGGHIIKWGNKSYLLKEFSTKPSAINKIWGVVFLARLPVFIIISLVGIFYFNRSIDQFLIVPIWILFDYIFFSFEAHLVYFKKFKLFFFVEITTIILGTIFLFIFQNRITTTLLLTIYTIRLGIKAGIAMIVFRNKTTLKNIPINLKPLKSIFPFFLTGLIGLLNSKIDFYSILFYLNEQEIGKYHILSNFILFGITIGSFIIIPFEKNIYRLTTSKVNKIAVNFLSLGLIISSIWIIVSKIIITKFYKIEFSIIIYLIGFLHILPIYYYWPILYKLYYKNKIVSTVKIGFISVLINLIFNVLLIPVYGILGALLSATLGQIAILVGYIIINKKNE